MAKARTPRHSKSTHQALTINLEPTEVQVIRNGDSPAQQQEDAAFREEAMAADDTARPQTADDFSSAEGDARLSSEERDSLTKAPDDQSDDTETKPVDENQPEPQAYTPRPETSVRQPERGTSRGTALGAGLAGGLIALIGAGALQFAGVLPAPQPDLSSLQQQIDTLKATPPASGGDSAALTTEVGDLKQTLATALGDLEKLQAAVSAGGAGEAGGVELLTGRLNEIEQKIATLAAAPAADPAASSVVADQLSALEAKVADSEASRQAVAALQSKVDELNARVEAGASQADIGLVIAANALKAAIDRGGAFTAELETYASVAPQPADVEALKPFADKGVPTLLDLQARFDGAAGQIIATTNKVDANAGILDRLTASAKNLVDVRPVGMVEGTGVDAITARIEAQLQAGKLPEALAEWETLPQDAKDVSAAFAADLKARLDADNLISKAVAAAISAQPNASN